MKSHQFSINPKNPINPENPGSDNPIYPINPSSDQISVFLQYHRPGHRLQSNLGKESPDSTGQCTG